MTNDEDKEPPVTDPTRATDIFANGAEIERIDGDIRITAWVDMSGERRIVARLILPDGAAGALARDLKKALARRGH
jgi:hypothetical protein